MTGGLLAVHAHPDDETLSTGALIATWAAAGLPVTVVTCTRGELGEVIPPELAHLEGAGERLATHRVVELREALRSLGAAGVFLDQLPLPSRARDDHVRDDRVLDDRVPDGRALGDRAFDDRAVASEDGPSPRYVDSGMVWMSAGLAGRADAVRQEALVARPLDEQAERLAGLIRELRPEVVVTYEPGGGYGHPDHVRAHQLTMRAVELAAEQPERPAGTGTAGAGTAGTGTPALPSSPHAVTAVLWAAVGADVLREAWRALATASVVAELPERATLVLPDPAGPLPSAAVPDDEVGLTVEVLPVLDRVLGALRAHRTQVQAVGVVRDVAAGSMLLGCHALSNRVLAPVLRQESYRFAPGLDGGLVCWPDGVTRVA